MTKHPKKEPKHFIKKPKQPRKKPPNLEPTQGKNCLSSLEKSLCSLVHLKKEPMTWLRKVSTQEETSFLQFFALKSNEHSILYKLQFTCLSPYYFYLPTLYLVFIKHLPFHKTFLFIV
jgi:hypothetical protein